MSLHWWCTVARTGAIRRGEPSRLETWCPARDPSGRLGGVQKPVGRQDPNATAVIVRRATTRDALAAAGVHCRAAVTAYASIFDPSLTKPTPRSLEPEWVELIAASGSMVLLAIAQPEGTVVGCVAIRRDNTVPTGFLLARLYVEPDRWGSGIGDTLHHAALDAIVALGSTAANLWVLEPNQRARSMYERRGWRLVPGPTQANIDPDVVDVLYQWERPEPTGQPGIDQPSMVDIVTERLRALIMSQNQNQNQSPNRPVLAAIDGRSGVGKSTLAAAVATELGDCNVIDGDDFYSGGAAEDWDRRSAEEKADLGIDWRRQRVALELLADGQPGSWHGYDWDAFDGSLNAEATVCEPASVIILEGAYSCRTELADLYQLRVLVEASEDERHRRLAERDGADYRDDWLGRWTEAEDHYFGHVVPPDRFDLVVRSEDLDHEPNRT